jgi:hypothetical protein
LNLRPLGYEPQEPGRGDASISSDSGNLSPNSHFCKVDSVSSVGRIDTFQAPNSGARHQKGTWSCGAARARGASPRPGTPFPFPFGLPTAPHPSRARHFVTQIVGRPFPIPARPWAGTSSLAAWSPMGEGGGQGASQGTPEDTRTAFGGLPGAPEPVSSPAKGSISPSQLFENPEQLEPLGKSLGGPKTGRGSSSIRGGRGRIPPLSKNDFLTIQRKFFRPLFLPISLGQIVPLSKLSPA